MTATTGIPSNRPGRSPVKRLFSGMMIIVGTLLSAFPPAATASPFRTVDDNDVVVLKKNVHPLARPEFDAGEAEASLPMERMILSLRPSPRKRADLENFLTGLHDPASPDYHRWLTPEEFKERFGPSPDDVQAVTGWLTSHGFSIDEIATGGAWINFSGTAAHIERAFHTRIHNFYVNGTLHHANSQDPAIPRAFSDLVSGIVSLHDFPRKMMNYGIRTVTPSSLPDFTSGTTHYLAPGDFATLYNVNALYNAGINGSGQAIAIVGRTHPSSTNWSTFRGLMGLFANPPLVIVNGPDPGDVSAGEDMEADLDVEWSGAVAKNATIKFVVSKSTGATDGVDLSAQYIVNNNLAPVMSTSFGSCEADMGAAENAFYNALWQQAAAQGITSFVSSGDAGAAGCNVGSDTSGSGPGVNGLASTPYNVAVGGTQFNEGTGAYWNTGNGTGYASALSYIPETAWNESGTVSGGSQLWATGGGVSSIYAKPAWQASPGVPTDGKRDIPDVSLSAAKHDAYLVQTQGALYAVGGTSASSPSFAGLMALIVQKTGQRQGNANGRFYQLANAQYGSSGVAVFHDIASGSNSVPGVTGYAGTFGYDLATGLGSVDAATLVNNWVPDFAVSAVPLSLSVPQGSSGTSGITTTVSGNFNTAVALSVSGLPAGATATFTPSSIVAPGAGSSAMTITAGSAAAAGTSPLTIIATGGGTTHTATVNLTIVQVFTITSSVANGIGGTITPASSAAVSGGNAVLTIAPAPGYYLLTLTDNGSDVTAGVTGGSYTITNVTASHMVIATFAATTFSITASVGSGAGTVTPTNSTVTYGSSITFTITPGQGYALGSLTDNGVAVTASAAGNGYTYTINNITGSHTIQAVFSLGAAATVPALGPWGIWAAAGALALVIRRRRHEQR